MRLDGLLAGVMLAARVYRPQTWIRLQLRAALHHLVERPFLRLRDQRALAASLASERAAA